MNVGERGSATVLAIALMGVLLTLGAGLGLTAATVHAHRVAASAADLTALAAAQAAVDGMSACSAGARLAAANDAWLVSCDLVGRIVTVTVRVRGPHWLGWGADLVGRARAGPAAGRQFSSSRTW